MSNRFPLDIYTLPERRFALSTKEVEAILFIVWGGLSRLFSIWLQKQEEQKIARKAKVSIRDTGSKGR